MTTLRLNEAGTDPDQHTLRTRDDVRAFTLQHYEEALDAICTAVARALRPYTPDRCRLRWEAYMRAKGIPVFEAVLPMAFEQTPGFMVYAHTVADVAYRFADKVADALPTPASHEDVRKVWRDITRRYVTREVRRAFAWIYGNPSGRYDRLLWSGTEQYGGLTVAHRWVGDMVQTSWVQLLEGFAEGQIKPGPIGKLPRPVRLAAEDQQRLQRSVVSVPDEGVLRSRELRYVFRAQPLEDPETGEDLWGLKKKIVEDFQQDEPPEWKPEYRAAWDLLTDEDRKAAIAYGIERNLEERERYFGVKRKAHRILQERPQAFLDRLAEIREEATHA